MYRKFAIATLVVALFLASSMAATAKQPYSPPIPAICNGSYVSLSESKWKQGNLVNATRKVNQCYGVRYSNNKNGNDVLRIWTRITPTATTTTTPNPNAQSVCTAIMNPGGGNAVCGDSTSVANNGWLNCVNARQVSGANIIWVIVGCSGVTPLGQCPDTNFTVSYQVQYSYVHGKNYTVQTCQTDFKSRGGLQWWGILLIVLALLVVIGGAIVLILYLLYANDPDGAVGTFLKTHVLSYFEKKPDISYDFNSYNEADKETNQEAEPLLKEKQEMN